MNDKPWLAHYDKGVPQTIEYPKAPLFHFLEEAARKYPDRACTIFKGAVVTYKEMNAVTDSIAAALVDMGVKKGDRVGMFMPNTPQFVMAYFGILKAGAAYVPLARGGLAFDGALPLEELVAALAPVLGVDADRIVKVPGGLAVDRHKGELAQIFPSLQIRRPELVRDPLERRAHPLEPFAHEVRLLRHWRNLLGRRLARRRRLWGDGQRQASRWHRPGD